ncbi:hypothetical protein DM060_09920 [Klebsiella pneumoniae]|nr:hypothetical protein B4U19_22485 [Klebsiella pneumoniae]RBZ38705.1 hypothetical protein DM069_11055 [Klebsiella pneumoniae]RBZ59762.1 hypothetical protein DM077_10755 [Klebsiella pneumoniae]RCJ97441.1 hypothetical protein DM060_09920 [Klebsiella pneumoniae]RCK98130.1 hypothetical protein DM058_09655 [Klebsiella pneumoniae]
MRKSRTPGSVRGVSGNGYPYRDIYTIVTPPSQTETLHKRLFYARSGMDKHHFTCNSSGS